MSKARSVFTKLDLLHDSANRLFDMIMKLPNKPTIASVEQKHEQKGENPLGAGGTMSEDEWFQLLERRAKGTPYDDPNEIVSTVDLILDELVSFEGLVSSSYSIAHKAIADRKVPLPVEAKDSRRDLITPSEDERLPWLTQLMPKDANERKLLSEKINMLNDVIMNVRRRIENTIENSQYDLSNISPILVHLNSALAVADREANPEQEKAEHLHLKQQHAISALKSKIKSDLADRLREEGATLEVINQKKAEAMAEFDAAHPGWAGPLTPEELNVLSLRWDETINAETVELDALRNELKNIEANPEFDLTYTWSNLTRLYFIVSALAGNKNPLPAVAANDSGAALLQPMAAAFNLSPADLERMKRFMNKEKIIALNLATHNINRASISNELKYHFILLSMLITMSETTQRGVKWSTRLWKGKPSQLRIELQRQLVSFLNISMQESLANFLLYIRKNVPYSVIQSTKQGNRNEWFIEVIATLFGKVLDSLPSLQTKLFRERFDRFVEVPKENRPFRDAVFEAMHRKGIYEKILLKFYTRDGDEEAVRKKYDLPKFATLNKKNQPSP